MEGIVVSSQDVITMQKVYEILPNIMSMAKKRKSLGGPLAWQKHTNFLS